MKAPAKARSGGLSRRFERAGRGALPASAIQIKTILVPLDFSPTSIEALSYAVPLAKKFGAALHLAHVSDKKEASEVFRPDELTCETVEWIQFLRDRLLLIHQKHFPPFWPKNDHVRAGEPYEQICNLARELDAGLIVIGTRGQTGLQRILLGSTAERVVGVAPGPGGVVPQPQPTQTKQKKKRQKN